ncbi:MAG TPA: hypothetical protein VK665_10370 [Candidatus Elarobacter sp.]|nr:hypothetical protein [Candidatus Elarobacter sp.]
MTSVPLLAALTDNLPGLFVVGFIILASIVQQLRAGKKAFDKAAARQRAERDAPGVPPPAQPVAMPQNAAQARALLRAEIEAMANARAQSSAQPSAVVQQPAPQQPSAVPAAAPQAATARQRQVPRQRTVWVDPGFGRVPAGSEAVDRSLATLPGTLATAASPGGLLKASDGARARSSTRRMLAGAFGDPAHARSAVILAEVLGTPLALR